MKRILLIAAIALTMVGLLAASGVRLLGPSPSPVHAAGSAGSSLPLAPIETMVTAGQLYEAGQYAQAAQAYQQLADQGYSDGALFYNLANAYFRQGDDGRAILNYRRAQRLMPRDPDVAANLALARARAVDRFDVAEDAATGDDAGALEGLVRMVAARLTLDKVALVALSAWMLFVLVLILFISTREGSQARHSLRYTLAVAAVVLAVGVLALGSVMYAGGSRSEGVIVAAEVDITSGPGTQYTPASTLHRGAEVDLIEVRGNWVRLALPEGDLEGWVPAAAVEAIDG